MFNDIATPLTYDPSRRLQARIIYAEAANRIEAGEAPESVGLPNIGTPAKVPPMPMTDASNGFTPAQKTPSN
jgi:hypothetical protein